MKKLLWFLLFVHPALCQMQQAIATSETPNNIYSGANSINDVNTVLLHTWSLVVPSNSCPSTGCTHDTLATNEIWVMSTGVDTIAAYNKSTGAFTRFIYFCDLVCNNAFYGSHPYQSYYDGTYLYFVDYSLDILRKIDTAGITTTIGASQCGVENYLFNTGQAAPSQTCVTTGAPWSSTSYMTSVNLGSTYEYGYTITAISGSGTSGSTATFTYSSPTGGAPSTITALLSTLSGFTGSNYRLNGVQVLPGSITGTTFTSVINSTYSAGSGLSASLGQIPVQANGTFNVHIRGLASDGTYLYIVDPSGYTYNPNSGPTCAYGRVQLLTTNGAYYNQYCTNVVSQSPSYIALYGNESYVTTTTSGIEVDSIANDSTFGYFRRKFTPTGRAAFSAAPISVINGELFAGDTELTGGGYPLYVLDPLSGNTKRIIGNYASNTIEAGCGQLPASPCNANGTFNNPATASLDNSTTPPSLFVADVNNYRVQNWKYPWSGSGQPWYTAVQSYSIQNSGTVSAPSWSGSGPYTASYTFGTGATYTGDSMLFTFLLTGAASDTITGLTDTAGDSCSSVNTSTGSAGTQNWKLSTWFCPVVSGGSGSTTWTVTSSQITGTATVVMEAFEINKTLPGTGWSTPTSSVPAIAKSSTCDTTFNCYNYGGSSVSLTAPGFVFSFIAVPLSQTVTSSAVLTYPGTQNWNSAYVKSVSSPSGCGSTCAMKMYWFTAQSTGTGGALYSPGNAGGVTYEPYWHLGSTAYYSMGMIVNVQ